MVIILNTEHSAHSMNWLYKQYYELKSKHYKSVTAATYLLAAGMVGLGYFGFLRTMPTIAAQFNQLSADIPKVAVKSNVLRHTLPASINGLRLAQGVALTALVGTGLNAIVQTPSWEDSAGKTGSKIEDVVGIPEEISYIVDIMEQSINQNEFQESVPKGYMFYGEPGVGKTLIANALGGDCDKNNVGFVKCSAAEFINTYRGTGPSAVKSLFDFARNLIKSGKRKGVIIFIDEMDALAKRTANQEHIEDQATINQLLTETDDKNKQNNGICILAATNFVTAADQALTRDGRLIPLSIPPLSIEEKREIIAKMLRNALDDVDNSLKSGEQHNAAIDYVAQRTQNFSSASIANIFKQAAHLAKQKTKIINLPPFKEAPSPITWEYIHQVYGKDLKKVKAPKELLI